MSVSERIKRILGVIYIGYMKGWVYILECSDVQEAFKIEHQIKKWSRAKKDALING